jgi:hypothetical protein
MRFAAISDQIKDVDRHVENLRMDMQEAIRREFMYLIQKMLSLKLDRADAPIQWNAFV